MIRHGIVLPLPDIVPPSSCKGGPAYCPTCNAEMIELESAAIRLSARAERRYGNTGEDVDALWLARGYRRTHFRQRAREALMFQLTGAADRAGATKTNRALYEQEYRKRPDVRARRKRQSEERYKRPDVIAKRKAAYAKRTAAQKERNRQTNRERWLRDHAKPDAKAKRRATYAKRSAELREKRRTYERERYRKVHGISESSFRRD